MHCSKIRERNLLNKIIAAALLSVVFAANALAGPEDSYDRTTDAKKLHGWISERKQHNQN